MSLASHQRAKLPLMLNILEVDRLLISHQALLLRVQSEAVEKSKPLFQSAVQHYEAAIQLLPEDERSKPIKQQVAGVGFKTLYTLPCTVLLVCMAPLKQQSPALGCWSDPLFSLPSVDAAQSASR